MGNAGWGSLKQKYDLQYDPGTHGFTRVWVDKGSMVFASLVKKDDRITRKKRMILLRSRFLDTTILLGALGGCQNGASGSARRRLFADSLPLERNPKRGTALLAQTRGVAWPRPTFPALVQQGKQGPLPRSAPCSGLRLDCLGWTGAHLSRPTDHQGTPCNPEIQGTRILAIRNAHPRKKSRVTLNNIEEHPDTSAVLYSKPKARSGRGGASGPTTGPPADVAGTASARNRSAGSRSPPANQQS